MEMRSKQEGSFKSLLFSALEARYERIERGGGNEKARVASGIHVMRMKRFIFTSSGFFISLAGVVVMAEALKQPLE